MEKRIDKKSENNKSEISQNKTVKKKEENNEEIIGERKEDEEYEGGR